jgi:hypothetical protein
MTLIPAISLWQPHASLLFVSDPLLRKQHETRRQPLPARCCGVRVAIHATQTSPKRMPDGLPDPHQLAVEAFGWDYREALPRGAIIGTLIFGGCVPSDGAVPASEADRIAGDWSPGRFIWSVRDRVLLPRPIPTKGRQGWFKAEVPPA